MPGDLVGGEAFDRREVEGFTLFEAQLAQRQVERRVVVETGDATVHLPVAVFDNRADYTTFLRDDPADWSPQQTRALHNRLIDVFDELDAMR